MGAAESSGSGSGDSDDGSEVKYWSILEGCAPGRQGSGSGAKETHFLLPKFCFAALKSDAWKRIGDWMGWPSPVIVAFKSVAV
jgi:hypothetical protein